MIADEAKVRRAAQLKTPSGLGAEATMDLTGALNALLADFFALYVKTKNFHWHVSGPHFRDSPPARRAGGPGLRRHRCPGRARAQARRRHASLDRSHRQAAAGARQ